MNPPSLLFSWIRSLDDRKRYSSRPAHNALIPSDMSAPKTVMAGALDVRVMPAIAMAPDRIAVKVWPRVAKTDHDRVGGYGDVGRTRGFLACREDTKYSSNSIGMVALASSAAVSAKR